MASLRDSVKDYQEELRDGIAWVAFWKQGRSWNAELFHLEVDGTLEPFDRSRLEEIKAADPAAVILNGYYCGHLGENMSLDELTAGVRHHYKNGTNDVAGVANEVRTAYYGTEATYIQELENKLNFRVQFDDQYTYDTKYLENLLIPNSTGRLIYLKNLATIEKADGLATLKHYNGERTITITAGIEYGKNTSQQVMNAVREKYKDFSKQYRGLKLEFGGEAKETVKALKQLAFSFAMAFIFVYIVLLLQLNRFIQPIMIMIIIPFGLIGVLLGFAIHRMPLSFMGVVGIIGLAGVVVNNGIILVDLINKIIDEGVEGGKKGVAKAIVEGAKQRLRPVFLTTVTTVVGLLPTVYGIGGRADIIIPIVMALAYGLLFASLLTLIFLPCMLKKFQN